MKNKIWKLFLIILVVFALMGCGNKKTDKEEEKVNKNDALLWKVESDSATIYLAGSIHIGDEDTYPLQQKLLDAFEASDALAVEFDLLKAQEDLEESMMLMVYLDGTNLTDYISEDTLEVFNNYVEEKGIMGITDPETLYIYKPWVLFNLISTDFTATNLNTDLGIDNYFIKEAYNKNMEIIEIESSQFQLELMDNFSSDLQELLLYNSLITDYEENLVQTEEMLDLWKKGDIEGLELLLNAEEELTEEDVIDVDIESLVDEYNTKLVTERNIAMTDKVEELLKGNKDVFYIVGSAHMIGEDGIVDLLQKRGYTVTKL